LTSWASKMPSTDQALELLFVRLRHKEGRLLELGANKTLSLADPDRVLLVYKGRLDVFVAEYANGEPVGARHFLLRAETGDLLCGLPVSERGLGLVVSPLPNSQAISVSRKRLQKVVEDLEYRGVLVRQLETWLQRLNEAIFVADAPRDYKTIEAGQSLCCQPGDVVRVRKQVLWVQPVSGHVDWCGRADTPVSQHPVLLSETVWLQANEDTCLQTHTTDSLMEADPGWTWLDAFSSLPNKGIDANIAALEAGQAASLLQKIDHDRAQFEGSLRTIANTFVAGVGETEAIVQDALLAACQQVGNARRIEVVAPPAQARDDQRVDSLSLIAQASKFYTRRVALRSAWWTQDNGALLGYYEEDKRPVALLPASPGRYVLVDPAAQAPIAVTPDVADQLDSFAVAFYRPFPSSRLSAGDLLRFTLPEMKSDLLRVFAGGILVGLLSMLTPLVAGIVFDQAIPQADTSQLGLLSLILVISAITVVLFQVVQNLAVLRLEGKLEAILQSAVWNRLLRLPAPFFRGYTAGDLASRAMSIDAMRQMLSGPVIGSVLSGVFSIFSAALLFYYSVPLGLVGLLLVLISLLVAMASGYRQVRYQRDLVNLEGRISGMVLQFIRGLTKFRVSGSEQRAFARWATAFGEQRRLQFKVQTIGNGLLVFVQVYPIACSIIIFALLRPLAPELSAGSFLAFNTAFIQFLLSSLQLASAFTVVLSTVPLFERAKPIITTLPEVGANKQHPGQLTGDIEINHVSFRYQPDRPLVLQDVSLQISRGEFVAIVGPSGCGKSTLLRLLLGFEAPDSGGIFYDGQDMTSLDITAVRRQSGVVLQNSSIMTGDIFSNIAGASRLTVEDAWDAARMAGLEEDIRRMPMGMHTVISEGGGTLSGGQRQRLLIARALVHKPHIVFFDEATSALDNKTQAIVSSSLEKLDATRIVIAHRLSTIMNADRIAVMQAGQIVQVGTYASLMRQRGLFATLVSRQLN